MRRRVRTDNRWPTPPAILLEYDAADWTGPMAGFSCEHPTCRWWDARDQWLEIHGIDKFSEDYSHYDALPMPEKTPNAVFHQERI